MFPFRSVDEAVQSILSEMTKPCELDLQLLEGFSDRDLYLVLGDSVLHQGRVILFCDANDDFGAAAIIKHFSEYSNGVSFSEGRTWVYLHEHEQPHVLNNNYKPSEDGIVHAPLGAVVYLADSEKSVKISKRGVKIQAGIVYPLKSTVVLHLSYFYGSRHKPKSHKPKSIRSPINFMLDKVLLFGYVPEINEDSYTAYRNILRHLEQH